MVRIIANDVTESSVDLDWDSYGLDVGPKPWEIKAIGKQHKSRKKWGWWGFRIKIINENITFEKSPQLVFRSHNLRFSSCETHVNYVNEVTVAKQLVVLDLLIVGIINQAGGFAHRLSSRRWMERVRDFHFGWIFLNLKNKFFALSSLSEYLLCKFRF